MKRKTRSFCETPGEILTVPLRRFAGARDEEVDDFQVWMIGCEEEPKEKQKLTNSDCSSLERITP